MDSIGLGSKVIDPITGLQGVVTARCAYLHGNPRVLIEGAKPDGSDFNLWIEESRAQRAD